MKTSLQQQITDLMKSYNLTLSVAESCTSGRVAFLITQIPGSSSYFKGGIIAYQDEVKHNLLSVNQNDIQSFTSVSRQVVQQMAENCLTKFDSDFAIATSGYSGPEGGSEKYPVGTIYIAVSNINYTKIERHFFKGSRSLIADKASHKALELLLQELKR